MSRLFYSNCILGLLFTSQLSLCQSKAKNLTTETNRLQINAADIKVGGPCDRCDIMYEGIPKTEDIEWQTRLANDTEPGDKMEIDGQIFQSDGITPAAGIVLYIYHTDATGLYTPAANQSSGRLNGHLRGWIRSNNEGKFKFYSIRPAPYPKASIPAHIHIYLKEPGKTLYYIDEVWFEDDPKVTSTMKKQAEKRGGDMTIALTKNQSDVWKGHLAITLGLNIPGYPIK